MDSLTRTRDNVRGLELDISLWCHSWTFSYYYRVSIAESFPPPLKDMLLMAHTTIIFQEKRSDLAVPYATTVFREALDTSQHVPPTGKQKKPTKAKEETFQLPTKQDFNSSTKSLLLKFSSGSIYREVIESKRVTSQPHVRNYFLMLD